MNFKERLNAILASLGFIDKAKASKLTDAEWTTIEQTYKAKYNAELKDDLIAEEAAKQNQEERKKILDVLNQADEEDTEEGTEEKTSEDQAEIIPILQNLVDENKQMKDQIAKMIPTAAADNAEVTIQTQITPNGPGTSKTHLFGIENDMFKLNHRWNKIAVNPAYSTLTPVDEDKDGPVFRAAAIDFGKSLAKRYRYLKDNNMLNAKKLAAGEFGFDTSHLPDAGLGDQYMIRRQDALIARILEYRTVTEFFPVRYGIQDREMITNAYFTEVSQAYQKGEIWKGNMKLEPEYGHVDDAMVKVLFGTMEEIERQYIGYLNTDGSDNIKWSMIEFALLNIYKQMQSEQNKRRIMGIYVKPETGVAGSYLNASTGVIYTLVRYYHENKFLLMDDQAYSDYDNTNFLDAVQEYVDDILAVVTEDQDINGKYLYLNNNHKNWWKKNVRAKYGKDTDFSGPDSYMNVVPDTEVRIKWLPNLGQLKLMMMQEPGNLQFLEFVAGEMYNVKFKDDMELVKAWSRWKEGTGAAYIGPTFKTKALLTKNNYRLQQIYMNKPCANLAQDTTAIPANEHTTFWFVTAENTQATVITDITEARAGIAYIIECGSTTNASKISKTGKFANITAAWTPTKVGDYIMVILDSTGKFLELERAVGGVREINKELQPNIPGAR